LREDPKSLYPRRAKMPAELIGTIPDSTCHQRMKARKWRSILGDR